jgi:uncharacterized damage-inducible protein DinB
VNVGITLEELFAWNLQTSDYWKAHLDAHPNLLALPCGIGGAATVQDFVRHIWGAELRWAQRLAGVEETAREKLPHGPIGALFDVHLQATELFRALLAGPESSWSGTYTLTFDWVPADKRNLSRRKIAVHALFHSQRHWAQLATLVRNAGFPSDFQGDLLFSPAMA